jgi:glycosyltransferase involved in cell wall biosynthesis
LESKFGVLSRRIKVIYNFVDFRQIEKKAKKEINYPFFANKDYHVIIAVGRLTEQKRFDRLLNAFALLKKEIKNVRLIVLGKGELFEKLNNLANELNIKDYVEFAGFQKNPWAWVSKAKIFVLSSDYEGFGNVIVEAMACGTPVISTNCLSGPNEIITHGKNGLLVPPADEKALAEAMRSLLENNKLRIMLAEEGKRRARDFRLEKILPQYERLF